MAFCVDMRETEFSAVILAGGESRRMGFDKAMIKCEGRTLLTRGIERARGLGAAEVFVSGRPGRDYSSVAQTVLYDRKPGLGPLGGIERALHVCRSPLLLVLAVDLPNMTTALLHKLLKCCDPLTGAVPELDGRLEPLAAIYPKRCHAFACEALANSRLAIREFASDSLHRRALRIVSISSEDAACFANWNVPADVRAWSGLDLNQC